MSRIWAYWYAAALTAAAGAYLLIAGSGLVYENPALLGEPLFALVAGGVLVAIGLLLSLWRILASKRAARLNRDSEQELYTRAEGESAPLPNPSVGILREYYRETIGGLHPASGAALPQVRQIAHEALERARTLYLEARQARLHALTDLDQGKARIQRLQEQLRLKAQQETDFILQEAKEQVEKQIGGLDQEWDFVQRTLAEARDLSSQAQRVLEEAQEEHLRAQALHSNAEHLRDEALRQLASATLEPSEPPASSGAWPQRSALSASPPEIEIVEGRGSGNSPACGAPDTAA